MSLTNIICRGTFLLLFSTALNAQSPCSEISGPINVPASGVIDGVFLQEHIPTKRMIPYENVREADVTWSTRIWRYIDLREKINLPLYYPLDEVTSYGTWRRNATHWSLWTIMRSNVLCGNLRLFAPYDPLSFGLGEKDGYELKYPVDPQPGLNYYTDEAFRDDVFWYLGRLGTENDTPLTDEYGDPIIITNEDGTEGYKYPPRDTFWYNSEDIIQYRLKEDWFFDKER